MTTIDKLNKLSRSHGALEAARKWPDRYGVVGVYVPNGFLRQLRFPFTWKG